MFDYSKKRPCYNRAFNSLNSLDLRFSKSVTLSEDGGLKVFGGGRDVTKEVKFTIDGNKGSHVRNLHAGSNVSGLDLSEVDFSVFHAEIDHLNSSLPEGIPAMAYDDALWLKIYSSDMNMSHENDACFSLFR